MRNVFNTKIADKFKEGRLSTDGDKPELTEWADLLEEDEDFAAEFNRLFDNTDVVEADDEFDPDSFRKTKSYRPTYSRGPPCPASWPKQPLWQPGQSPQTPSRLRQRRLRQITPLGGCS